MSTASAASLTHPEPGSGSLSLDWFAVHIPVRALTLAGFREWATSPSFPEHLRAAFLDEEIFLDTSNEDPELHVMVKTVFCGVLFQLNQAEKKGRFYSDGMLVSNEEANVSNNPDATFVLWKTLRSGKARIVQREGEEGRFKELEGTPDWVLEVVSDSSVQKDTVCLREAYHRAGIPEYWIVDVRGEEVVFQILHRRKNGYLQAPVNDGWQLSRVFGREFRFTRRQVELDLWDYHLEMRAP
jgi:Uma2 family endonuclease